MHPDFDHKTTFHNILQALNPIFHESTEEVDITETYILNGKITGQKFASIHPVDLVIIKANKIIPDLQKLPIIRKKD